ncbi:MAG: WD40/YVTN/BNR-like repeat-containing protein, partial [Peptostreptococcaceae bacterium]
IAGLCRMGYLIYEQNEIGNLINVANDFFNEYTEKGKLSYQEKGMEAVYTNKETVIVAGDKDEFMAMVYFDVDVAVNGENDFTSSYHKMRIKKDNDGSYYLIDEGNMVNREGLEIVNYSNKQKQKEELSEIKKEIGTNETKKILGVYYQMTSNGLRLSYNKMKDWVSVPIPNEYIDAIFDFDNNKLKENISYISHKKTAFISHFNSDILIIVTDDKGQTWNEIKLDDAYQEGDLFIGFSNQDIGYIAITTDIAMGKQYSYIYITSDGGKTYNEIGNTNEVYPRVITGVGFLDEKIGFVGFRYESDNNPTVYRTEDSGSTWTKLDIKLPVQYIDDYATPLNLKFENDKIMLPVKLRDNDKIINFISTDKGLNFEYVDN